MNFYAKFLPSRAGDGLISWARRDRPRRRSPTHPTLPRGPLEPKPGTWRMAELGVKDIAEVPESVNGEPWWDRTTDPLIKSQVLYQLS